MKKLKVLILCLCAFFAHGQNGTGKLSPEKKSLDVSVWHSSSEFFTQKPSFYARATFVGKVRAWQFRSESDWPMTYAFAVGRMLVFGKGKFFLNPRLALLLAQNNNWKHGGFDGFSLEFDCGGTFRNFHYFNFFERGTGVSWAHGYVTPSFYYNYGYFGWRYKFIQINYSIQARVISVWERRENRWKESNYEWLDQGPQIFLYIGKFYAKAWYTYDFLHKSRIQKCILTIGFNIQATKFRFKNKQTGGQVKVSSINKSFSLNMGSFLLCVFKVFFYHIPV